MEQKTRNQYGLWFWCYKGKPITSKSSEDETTNSEPEIKVFDTLEEVRAYEKKIDQFCPIEVWKQEYIYDSDCDCLDWETIEESRHYIQE